MILKEMSFKELMDIGCLVAGDRFSLNQEPGYTTSYDESVGGSIILKDDGLIYLHIRSSTRQSETLSYPSEVHDLLCPVDHIKKILHDKIRAIYVLRGNQKILITVLLEPLYIEANKSNLIYLEKDGKLERITDKTQDEDIFQAVWISPQATFAEAYQRTSRLVKYDNQIMWIWMWAKPIILK